MKRLDESLSVAGLHKSLTGKSVSTLDLAGVVNGNAKLPNPGPPVDPRWQRTSIVSVGTEQEG